MGPVFVVAAIRLFIFLLAIPGVAAQQADNGYRLKTIIIDAGHGGKDPGCLGKLTTEKEVVLNIALKLGKLIENQIPDVQVIYTRKTDEFIPLHQRSEIANSNKANLFISIHANASPNIRASGTESLVLGLHRSGENFEVAKKENSVIFLEDDYHTKYEGFDPNSPESYIVFSLMQNLYFDQSINMAAMVQDELRERARRKDRGVKQQGLLVLARSSMPSLMVEAGFVTNPEEEKYLMSDEGQDYIASAIFRAFRNYKKIIESKSSFAMSSRISKPVIEEMAEIKPDSIVPEGFADVKLTPPPVNNPLPRVEFKVQIAASSRPIAPGSHAFKGLTGISEYHVGDVYKYAIGSSPTFQEIITYSKQVKERFPDAFIIAVKDSGIIPLDQALQETQQNKSN